MTQQDALEGLLRSALRDGVDAEASLTLQAQVMAIPTAEPAGASRRWREPFFLRNRMLAISVVIATLAVVGLGLGVATWRNIGTNPTVPPASSASPNAAASTRAFEDWEMAGLQVQDGDLGGGKVTAGEAPFSEPSTAAWTAHIREHGLRLRLWTWLDSSDPAPLGYAYVGGAGVSLWADAQSAVAALAFENRTPPTGIKIVSSVPVAELGEEGWCGVLDFPPDMDDRAWCRFAVSNATFDLYMRTGDRLDPRAIGDLTDLGVLLRQRAASLAAEP
jgi:hypothetical protein